MLEVCERASDAIHKDDDRRMVSQSRDSLLGLDLDARDKLVVRWILAATKLGRRKAYAHSRLMVIFPSAPAPSCELAD